MVKKKSHPEASAFAAPEQILVQTATDSIADRNSIICISPDFIPQPLVEILSEFKVTLGGQWWRPPERAKNPLTMEVKGKKFFIPPGVWKTIDINGKISLTGLMNDADLNGTIQLKWGLTSIQCVLDFSFRDDKSKKYEFHWVKVFRAKAFASGV